MAQGWILPTRHPLKPDVFAATTVGQVSTTNAPRDQQHERFWLAVGSFRLDLTCRVQLCMMGRILNMIFVLIALLSISLPK